MSMICYLLRVSPDLARQISEDKILCDGVTSRATTALGEAEFERSIAHIPEDDKAGARKRREEALAAADERLRKQFREVLEESDRAKQRAAHVALEPAICLEKAWDVIEHILTNDGHNAVDGLFVGANVGSNLGYGPAFLRDVVQTASLSDRLNHRATEDFMSGVDLSSADKLYAMENADAGAMREVFDTYFPALRAYAAEARANGNCLLTWIS